MKHLNIEDIIDALTGVETNIKSFTKRDAITITCEVKDGYNVNDEITNIKNHCKTLKFPSTLTEVNKDDEKEFILQFPDLEPYYSDELIRDIYIYNTNKVLDVSFHNDYKVKLNNEVVRQNKQAFISQIMFTYYRNYVNRYKCRLEDYRNNEQNRALASDIFDEVMSTYEFKGERVVIEEDKEK